MNWGSEEVPLLVHYAGCTVCHPPEGKLSEEVGRSPVHWSPHHLLALVHTCCCAGFKCLYPCLCLYIQVIRGCNDEFAKAYRYARCNLAAAYTNLSSAAICHYPAVDLSDMSIRLGV